jgi:hypothetical protein
VSRSFAGARTPAPPPPARRESRPDHAKRAAGMQPKPCGGIGAHFEPRGRRRGGGGTARGGGNRCDAAGFTARFRPCAATSRSPNRYGRCASRAVMRCRAASSSARSSSRSRSSDVGRDALPRPGAFSFSGVRVARPVARLGFPALLWAMRPPPLLRMAGVPRRSMPGRGPTLGWPPDRVKQKGRRGWNLGLPSHTCGMGLGAGALTWLLRALISVALSPNTRAAREAGRLLSFRIDPLGG